ncbi:MAG TPA: 3',5'-cyclic-nucleotide phosphodiesterase [Polyangia bacterium]|nr:3',5'-cyclic-nucleotide phosphodiesterase [Polyangia bacterium]
MFELRALGVLGGDDDTNLSCYLLGRAGEVAAPLMIDGGSVVPGIVRMLERDGRLAPDASWSTRMKAALEVLRPVRALLLTHAHLDHLAGFVIKTTLDLSLANEGRPPLEIVGLPGTLEAVRTIALRPPLWADFTGIPPGNPTLRLAPLAPGAQREIGPFRVQLAPLRHPVDSAGFLVTVGEDAYLHLGDTSASEAVWALARPHLARGRLRAVAIEVSFPGAKESLAAATGHLTPRSLLVELAKLAGVPGAPEASRMSEAEARALAGRLAPRLRGCTVVALHIKALEYDQVVAELEALRAVGLPVLIPQQGERYRF